MVSISSESGFTLFYPSSACDILYSCAVSIFHCYTTLMNTLLLSSVLSCVAPLIDSIDIFQFFIFFVVFFLIFFSIFTFFSPQNKFNQKQFDISSNSELQMNRPSNINLVFHSAKKWNQSTRQYLHIKHSQAYAVLWYRWVFLTRTTSEKFHCQPKHGRSFSRPYSWESVHTRKKREILARRILERLGEVWRVEEQRRHGKKVHPKWIGNIKKTAVWKRERKSLPLNESTQCKNMNKVHWIFLSLHCNE